MWKGLACDSRWKVERILMLRPLERQGHQAYRVGRAWKVTHKTIGRTERYPPFDTWKEAFEFAVGRARRWTTGLYPDAAINGKETLDKSVA